MLGCTVGWDAEECDQHSGHTLGNEDDNKYLRLLPEKRFDSGGAAARDPAGAAV